jgi:hypothetical protein
MTERTYTVRAEWDGEACVWIATSDDVPGLCCEAGTFEELVDVVLALVPELLAENGVAPPTPEVTVNVIAERQAVARLTA